MVFVLITDVADPETQADQQPKKFYQIASNLVNGFDSVFFMLKISDVSVNIKYDLSIGEKRLLELVNACVSHEMRNPINAIMAMTAELRDLTAQVFAMWMNGESFETNVSQNLKTKVIEAIGI